MIGTALTWLVVNRNKLVKAVLGVAVAILLSWGIILHKQNKKLSESLERAQNNIEAYQGSLAGSQQANNVLRLTVDELQTQNDILVHKVDSVREKLKIKSKQLKTAATQSQSINVNQSKQLRDTLYRDNIYKDSIKFNDLTTVSYCIGKDSINIGLNINNQQYLYVFNDKHYKNKNIILKRLNTFDFNKVTTTKYNIENTNDLLKTEDVRIVESIK